MEALAEHDNGKPQPQLLAAILSTHHGAQTHAEIPDCASGPCCQGV